MYRRKHFRFRQKYRPRPQASADDWYPVLPSAVGDNDLEVSAA